MVYPEVLMCLVISAIGLSESAFVDTLHKCKLRDFDCHKNLLQNILKDVAVTGIPELDIPPLDPLVLKNMKFKVHNVFEMTLIDGTAKGVKNCIVNKFETNLETRHAYLDMTCDIVFQGKYEIKSYGDIIKNLFGGEVHGKGNGILNIDKIKITIDFPIDVVKHKGDIYLTGDIKKFKHTFEVLGKISVHADNLWLGKTESSKELVKIVNENWKILVGSFGNDFFNVAMTTVYDYIDKIFTKTPTKYFILDDLTPYL